MKMDMGQGLMFEYRYMDMLMDGNRDGTENLSTSEVTDRGFNMASPKMRMQMHMFMGMYTFNPGFSAMAMLNYLDQEMDMVNAAGSPLPRMSSSGMGDTKLGLIYKPMTSGMGQATFKLALSLPTGSTDETGLMMGNPSTTLPYPMQLGSGTYDLEPEANYRLMTGAWRWTATAGATLRLGRNDENYSLGNRARLGLAASRSLTSRLRIGGGLKAEHWGDIDGQDSRIMPSMSPYGNPELQGGKRANLGLVLDYSLTPRLGLALDYQTPVYEDLDGPQMSLERSWSLSLKAML